MRKRGFLESCPFCEGKGYIEWLEGYLTPTKYCKHCKGLGVINKQKIKEIKGCQYGSKRFY